jgi:transposase-like protein
MRLFNPFAKTLSGTLKCPTCDSLEIAKIEHLGPYMTRYRCKKCNLPFRYEYANKVMPKNYNPYASFTRGLNFIPRGKLK